MDCDFYVSSSSNSISDWVSKVDLEILICSFIGANFVIGRIVEWSKGKRICTEWTLLSAPFMTFYDC